MFKSLKKFIGLKMTKEMLQYGDQKFTYKAQWVEHEISQIKLTMLNTTCHTKPVH